MIFLKDMVILLPIEYQTFTISNISTFNYFHNIFCLKTVVHALYKRKTNGSTTDFLTKKMP
jgi:hypothetical protein